MNKKTILLFLCICLVLIPYFLWGQANPNVNPDDLQNFLKGDGTLEDWFMQGFAKIDTRIQQEANNVARLGRAIAGFGALLYFGILGWRMQMGDAEWSFEPMLKPFFIGLILINWTGFVDIIKYPFEILAHPSEAIFTDIERKADDLRTLRFKKQIQVLDASIELKSKNDIQKEGFWSKLSNGEVLDALGDQMDKLLQPIAEFSERMNYQFQKLFGEILEWICLLILRFGVYFIFFIQKVWSYVLIILGPISFGIALIPGFDSSIYNWIAKFININLYTFVAYTIINIGQQIIMAGYTMEIERLREIVSDTGVVNESLLVSYVSYNGAINSILFPCVAYLITGIGVLMTPTIADAIVSAGGAGVMSKAKAGAGAVAGASASAGRAGMRGAKAGARASVNAGKKIGQGISGLMNKFKNK